MNLQNNAKDEWSQDMRQLIGEIVITMGTEKGEKLVAEIKNKIHHQLQKAREEAVDELLTDIDFSYLLKEQKRGEFGHVTSELERLAFKYRI